MKEKDSKFLDAFTGKGEPELETPSELSQRAEAGWVRVWLTDYPEEGSELIKSPFGSVGTKLWCKETWNEDDSHGIIFYKADFPQVIDDDGEIRHIKETDFKWRPSIHMPQWASRLTIETKSVMVVRVQELSEEDCYKNGIEDTDEYNKAEHHELGGSHVEGGIIKYAFVELWQSTYGKKYPYETNPYVFLGEISRSNETSLP